MVVQVSDGDMSSAVTFPVTVSEVNEDPVLNPIGSKSVNKLEALTFTATASDGDVIGGTADTLEFSLAPAPRRAPPSRQAARSPGRRQQARQARTLSR